tara:strand:+ start:7217 stop:7621 length:405 start_codon:yes stop_codon:yes gene_type:complete
MNKTAVLKSVLFGIIATGMVFTTMESASAGKKVRGLYRHVVMFQFNEDVTDEQVKEIEKAFLALGDKIDTIIDVEFGTNVSPEGLNEGLTHCFLVTFKDKKGLEVYLPHKAHQQFVDLVKPRLAKVVVIDYVSR